ncbi:hypothetical protein ACFV1C_22365, partial [Streptomyces sp. NPDC059605]
MSKTSRIAGAVIGMVALAGSRGARGGARRGEGESGPGAARGAAGGGGEGGGGGGAAALTPAHGR